MTELAPAVKLLWRASQQPAQASELSYTYTCIFIISGESDVPQEHLYSPTNTTRPGFLPRLKDASIYSVTASHSGWSSVTGGLRPAALPDPPPDHGALAEGREAVCCQSKGGSAPLLKTQAAPASAGMQLSCGGFPWPYPMGMARSLHSTTKEPACPLPPQLSAFPTRRF